MLFRRDQAKFRMLCTALASPALVLLALPHDLAMVSILTLTSLAAPLVSVWGLCRMRGRWTEEVILRNTAPKSGRDAAVARWLRRWSPFGLFVAVAGLAAAGYHDLEPETFIRFLAMLMALAFALACMMAGFRLLDHSAMGSRPVMVALASVALCTSTVPMSGTALFLSYEREKMLAVSIGESAFDADVRRAALVLEPEDRDRLFREFGTVRGAE